MKMPVTVWQIDIDAFVCDIEQEIVEGVILRKTNLNCNQRKHIAKLEIR